MRLIKLPIIISLILSLLAGPVLADQTPPAAEPGTDGEVPAAV